MIGSSRNKFEINRINSKDNPAGKVLRSFTVKSIQDGINISKQLDFIWVHIFFL